MLRHDVSTRTVDDGQFCTIDTKMCPEEKRQTRCIMGPFICSDVTEGLERLSIPAYPTKLHERSSDKVALSCLRPLGRGSLANSLPLLPIFPPYLTLMRPRNADDVPYFH